MVWALKIETYLGPEMAMSVASAIGDQKRAQAKSQKSPTLTMAKVMDLPASKALSPSAIKKGTLVVLCT